MALAWSAFMTTKRARSASCCATCFDSTALVNCRKAGREAGGGGRSPTSRGPAAHRPPQILGGHGRPGPEGLRRLPVAAGGRAAHLGAKREVGDGHVIDQNAELCGALGQLATHGRRDLHVHGSRQVG